MAAGAQGAAAAGRGGLPAVGLDGLAHGLRQRPVGLGRHEARVDGVQRIQRRKVGGYLLTTAQAATDVGISDEVEVITQRLVGTRHLKLSLRMQGTVRDGIWFGRSEPLPARAQLAYRLSLDEFQGRQRVQMVVEGLAEGDQVVASGQFLVDSEAQRTSLLGPLTVQTRRFVRM